MDKQNEVVTKEEQLTAAEESLRTLKVATGVKAGAVPFIAAASEKSSPAFVNRQVTSILVARLR